MMAGNTTTVRVHRGLQLAARNVCHWELRQGERALAAFNEADLDFLIADELGKYWKAFRHGRVRVNSKTSLLPHVPFSDSNATQDALCVPPELNVLAISTLTSDGVETWCELSTQRRQALLDMGNASPTDCVVVN